MMLCVNAWDIKTPKANSKTKNFISEGMIYVALKTPFSNVIVMLVVKSILTKAIRSYIICHGHDKLKTVLGKGARVH